MFEALRVVQARFLAGVIDGAADAEALIVDDDHVGARRRLDIYRNNYRASLTGVLADHYSRLFAYLGADQFGHVARAYVAAYPSTTRNLRYYGDMFVGFLANNYPDDGELAELAAIDWGLREAFDAPDVAVLDAAGVGALGDALIERSLTLHPSARLLTVRHNIAAIWSALDSETNPPAVEPFAVPVQLLVWRSGQQPKFRSLSADEGAMFARLEAAANFTDLSAQAIERLGEAAALAALAGWLGIWLGDGVLMSAD
ncbi:putative DNA-binding domain-containing protein [Sphingopyxis sp.]|uniref:HvfC/BufC family peptide modification chaperone n=1 Tax=Sphingopyxis sp. TaxID=1908224 RepID=UPI003D0BEBC6